jgi:hypothetical protein
MGPTVGFPDNRDALIIVQHCSQPDSNDLVIIDQEQPDRGGLGRRDTAAA